MYRVFLARAAEKQLKQLSASHHCGSSHSDLEISSHGSAFEILSPAKAGLFLIGIVVPGLRSLRSLTRGYRYAAPRALVESRIRHESRLSQLS